MCGHQPCNQPNCTWGHAHLIECEARWVSKMPREWRMDYYADVLKKRGKSALEDLKARVNAAWKERNQESLF